MTVRSAREPTVRVPTSVRRNAFAPPIVAAASACAGESPISRTASAMTKGIELVAHVPGLQSVASAIETPASSRAAASG